MAGQQHRTPEYLAEKRRLTPIILNHGALCVEPVCLHRSRVIPAGTPARGWHLSHDTTGLVILGPSHRRCNLAEAARRNNPKRRPRLLVANGRDWKL